MLLFVSALLILALIGCKPIFGKAFYLDYAAPDQTRCINGICILLILLSHSFVKSDNILDTMYETMRIFLGQFVVVPFLFYSGYGIMESLCKKDSYIRTFPKKRFLKLAIQFAIITVLYIILHLLLQSDYTIADMLLSFTGIRSIGNGGWYMLSTFVFYIAVILCFNLFKKNKLLAAIGVAFCLIALMVIEIVAAFPSYYYSTTIFFAVGMFYSLLKKQFDSVVMKNNITWFISLLISIAGLIVSKSLVTKSILFYPVWCGFGMLIILCITMKVKLQNIALNWLGKTVFFIFTLQGIPQILFTKFLTNNYLIYALVIAATLPLAFVAELLFKRAEKMLQKQETAV